MGLLYGAYEREPTGALHYVATGQRLVPGPIVRDRILVEYRDHEIALPVLVRLSEAGPPHPSSYFGTDAVVDWNLRQHTAVRKDYGLWRRLTWFLLDALLVWLIEEGRPQRSVLVFGGWFNGSWLRKGRFFHSGSKPQAGGDVLAETIPPYDPVRPRPVAPQWHFERGLPGAREGRIAVRPGDEGLPVADLRVPIHQQLSDVPRFISSDGSILFFHRVVPHTGPEYTPSMQYGLVGTDYAFYFTAAHATLVDVPITLRPGRAPHPPRLREQVPELLEPFTTGGRWRVHPVLREELFFAGAEAYALTFEKPPESWPSMRSVQHDQEMPFGHHLGEISDAPISVGLRAALKSWPRLATESPELGWNLVDWLRRRRVVRQKRQWLILQDELLRGKLPPRG